MPDAWTPLLIGVVAGAVLLYGISKTAMPVLGVLAGPVLAAALGPTTASAFAVPLLIAGDLVALSIYRQHADWKLIWRIVPGVLVGFVITAFMFAFLDQHIVARFLGVLILASIVLEVWQRRQKSVQMAQADAAGEVWVEGDPKVNRASAAFFGALAGMTTMAANAGGTAMTLYLVKLRVPMLAFMGTSAWFFFILNIAKIPIVVGLGLLDGHSLLADLAFLPVMLIGTALGIVVFRKMNQSLFANLALVLSGVASVWLIIHG